MNAYYRSHVDNATALLTHHDWGTSMNKVESRLQVYSNNCIPLGFAHTHHQAVLSDTCVVYQNIYRTEFFLNLSYYVSSVFERSCVRSVSFIRLAEVARTVQTTHFTNLVWLLELDNRSIFRHMGDETPQMRADDLVKAARPGLLPHYWQFLDALDCDGYFGEPRVPDGEY